MIQEDAISHGSDVKTLLTWSAPGRPFRKKGREYYVFIFVLLVLFEIILFLFSQYELMVVVLSLAFLSVVLSSVPPRNFHYKITTQGIQIEDHFYIWDELYDFYFRSVESVDTLVVRTVSIFPGELRISLSGAGREHVRQVLVRYLPYREVVKSTFLERSADFLSRTFPLEREH